MFNVKNRKSEIPKKQKRNTTINEIADDSSEEEKAYSKSSHKSKTGISKMNKILSQKNSLKLHRLILENFKSFEGRHEIGYFQNFSVVLGPNGSGKSNIIDAICFALGMKTISLRTKNLKDLIHKKEYDEESPAKSSYVELFFRQGDEELSFKRTISPKGTSDFYYNNKKISVDEYLKHLESLEIPSKARYFILVQGAIDTLLSKKNDLTETIEYLSGSFEYKEDYEKVKAEIATLNQEIGKLSNQMHSIKDDRNKVKTQIENEEKYNELINKLKQTLNKIYLYKLAENDLVIKTNEQNLTQNEESMRIAQDEKKEILDFVKSKEVEIRKIESELKKEEVENPSNYKIKVEEINNRLTECVESLKLYETQVFSKMSMLNQQKNGKKKKDEKKEYLAEQANQLERQIEKLKKQIDLDTEVKSENLNKNQIEEYRQISNNAEFETFQLNKEKEKTQLAISELTKQKTILEKNLLKIENEKISLEEDLKTNQEKLEREEVNRKKLELENLANKTLLSTKDAEKMKFEADWTELNRSLNDKISRLYTYENENLENQKRRKITELMAKNSNVYGFLYELITPLQKKLEIPIKVSLLKYLNYLVVENSETAKECSDYLKTKEISADVLVLSNIPEKESDEAIRMKLGNLGNLVVDLIDCKKKGLKNALNYFLSDMVLCYERENITKLRQKGFNSVVLVDGTMYKKSTISGGNYKNLEQFSFNYKINNQSEIEKLKKEIENLNKQIHQLEDKRNDYKELHLLKNKIIEKENQIEIANKNVSLFTATIDKIKVSLKTKEQQLQELTESVSTAEKEYVVLSKELEEINDRKNDLKNKFYSSFMKKYNLTSLKEFEPYSLAEVKRLSEELKSNEEKLSKIYSQIKSLESNDELINKLEISLNEDKEKKKNLELEKGNLDTQLRGSKKEWEKYKEGKNEEYRKVNELRENLKLKQGDLDKMDKRIRNLLKNKIEYEHNIVNSIEKKIIIVEESKLNMDGYLKDLNNLNQNFSIFISLDVNVDRFVISNENKLNKKNIIIDYEEIETKSKISERTTEAIRDKAEKSREKFLGLMRELEKYVKLCSLNETEANKLKDREEELARKKKNISLQVQSLINDLDTKKEEFEKIKTSRKKLFETFFSQLAQKLSSFYKELTKPQDSLNPGGSAYIYNTNEDEPYLGSVCYLPTPPGKRVIYDIDQLSGGEKTIAILSLVISLQSICQTPFIILDEIDSYLDPEHEGILENLFKTQNKNFQIILITHKSNIFRSAESLIGTYFHKQRYSSIPISVDMTKIF